MRALTTCWGVLTSLAVAGVTGAADWPRFRGPDGGATSQDAKVPTRWGDKNNLKWKRELPGDGFSSPIVVGEYVFVTCYTGGEGDLTDLRRHLVCVDRREGKVLWSRAVPAALPE